MGKYKLVLNNMILCCCLMGLFATYVQINMIENGLFWASETFAVGYSIQVSHNAGEENQSNMPTEIAFDYLTSDVTLTNVSFMSTQ